jgi:hypothetical protein
MRPCQQRIVAEVDARHHVRRAERDLLGLGEEVVRVAVEHQAADRRTGTSSSGISLVASRMSKLNAFGLLFGEELQAQLPLGVLAGLDRFPEIAAVKVRIGAGDLDRLVPHERVRAELPASSGT